MQPAPIALFCYKRLQHTRQTVEALRKNGLATESELFVFSDGARTEADAGKVREVREYLKTVTGFKSITVVERERNLGLARSIIAGVTEIVEKHGRIIVLEDDMVTSPHFLRYMNEALELYEQEERVISIHGYVYPVRGSLPETFFLKGADCWGWGTWKRGWELFEPDGRKLLTELRRRGLLRRFDYNGAHHYTRMLEDQIAGKNDSWAVRWYASALLADRLTLYPGRSLVCNIGTDESGTHCDVTSVYDTEVAQRPLKVGGIPAEENETALREFEKYFRATRPPLLQRVLRYLQRV